MPCDAYKGPSLSSTRRVPTPSPTPTHIFPYTPSLPPPPPTPIPPPTHTDTHFYPSQTPPPPQIDDPLDAIAVHAGGAMWGMLGCAAFAAPNMVEDWYGPYPGAVLVDGAYSPVRTRPPCCAPPRPCPPCCRVSTLPLPHAPVARWNRGSSHPLLARAPRMRPPLIDPCAHTRRAGLPLHPSPAPQSREYGFIMGGSGAVLAAHCVYILVIAAWVCGIMTPFFLLLNRLGLMRVPPGERVPRLGVAWAGGLRVYARAAAGPCLPPLPLRSLCAAARPPAPTAQPLVGGAVALPSLTPATSCCPPTPPHPRAPPPPPLPQTWRPWA